MFSETDIRAICSYPKMVQLQCNTVASLALLRSDKPLAEARAEFVETIVAPLDEEDKQGGRDQVAKELTETRRSFWEFACRCTGPAGDTVMHDAYTGWIAHRAKTGEWEGNTVAEMITATAGRAEVEDKPGAVYEILRTATLGGMCPEAGHDAEAAEEALLDVLYTIAGKALAKQALKLPEVIKDTKELVANAAKFPAMLLGNILPPDAMAIVQEYREANGGEAEDGDAGETSILGGDLGEMVERFKQMLESATDEADSAPRAEPQQPPAVRIIQDALLAVFPRHAGDDIEDATPEQVAERAKQFGAAGQRAYAWGMSPDTLQVETPEGKFNLIDQVVDEGLGVEEVVAMLKADKISQVKQPVTAVNE